MLQRYYTSLIKSHGGFTQAPEPAENPLITLPAPSIKSTPASPRLAEEDRDIIAESPEAGPSSLAQPPPPNDIPSSPNKRGRRRASQTLGSESDSVPENAYANGNRHSPRDNSAPDSGNGKMEMDVDEQESPSSNERVASSPASSSIPSSSRSSLRTRNVSMTQLDPSTGIAASPRIDTTPATGRVGVGMEVDSQADKPQEVAASSDHIDAEGRSGHHGGGAGGKLLKSIVGGIFRRHDSSHHSDPPPSTTTSQSQLQTNGNGSSQRLVPPHQSPGRRVKSPLMNAYAQGEPPTMAAPVTPRVRSREETTSEC